MKTEEQSPRADISRRYIYEYDEKEQDFLILAPSVPHGNGGSSRLHYAHVAEESDAITIVKALNGELIEAPQLSKEEQTEGEPIIVYERKPWKLLKMPDGGTIADISGRLIAEIFIPEEAEFFYRAPELASSLSRVEGERDELKRENQRLKNDLLDALDLKEGKGPTALSMVTSELSTLRDERNRMKEALEELVSYQNGPPLPTYEKGWNKAMEKAYALLSDSTTKTE